MELETNTLSADDAYRWMTMMVVPRPIAWITSVDRDGHVNVAPFSFFTCLSANPPLIGVTLMSRRGDPKDTLANILDTHEFVVNVVTEDTLPLANLTSIEAPHEFSESDYAGLRLAPAATVKPPRLADSPVHMECRLNTVMRYGLDDEHSHPAHFLVGQMQHVGVDDKLIQDGRIDPEKLAAVGRLGGPLYCSTRDLISVERPRYPDDTKEAHRPSSR